LTWGRSRSPGRAMDITDRLSINAGWSTTSAGVVSSRICDFIPSHPLHQIFTNRRRSLRTTILRACNAGDCLRRAPRTSSADRAKPYRSGTNVARRGPDGCEATLFEFGRDGSVLEDAHIASAEPAKPGSMSSPPNITRSSSCFPLSGIISLSYRVEGHRPVGTGSPPPQDECPRSKPSMWRALSLSDPLCHCDLEVIRNTPEHCVVRPRFLQHAARDEF